MKTTFFRIICYFQSFLAMLTVNFMSILFLFVVFFASSVKILREYERGVVFRLGAKKMIVFQPNPQFKQRSWKVPGQVRIPANSHGIQHLAEVHWICVEVIVLVGTQELSR